MPVQFITHGLATLCHALSRTSHAAVIPVAGSIRSSYACSCDNGLSWPLPLSAANRSFVNQQPPMWMHSIALRPSRGE
ncbi:hypothetical protein BX600DRAFT_65092 [Xylariales sp. PMI_506]|nr:hypothetical protein BX600DRAFT_65092 [Xylariales sp. PMI_506]